MDRLGFVCFFNKYFKGWNGTKAARQYAISILGDDIKACTVTVSPEMRSQLKNLLKNKRMNREIMLMRRIIQNYNYK